MKGCKRYHADRQISPRDLKFILKKENAIDYDVLPFEALWWAENMSTFATEKKDDWEWTAMIMQPGIISHEMALFQQNHLTCLDKFI